MRVPGHAVRRSRAYLSGVADRRRREIRMRRHYRRLIDPHALVFDIGASRGDWTAVFRSLGATVVAVEPVRETAEELRRRFRKDARVKVVEKAVTASTEPVRLHINAIPELCSISPGWIEATQRSGRFSQWGSHWVEDRTVSATTVDQLIAEFGRPRFCKIDVEGSEAEVLEGATVPVDFLSFEFVAERPRNALECISRLDRRGFRSYNLSYGDTFRFVRDEWLARAAIEESLPALLTPGVWGDLYAAQDLSSPAA